LSELDCKHLSEVSNDIAERDLIAAFDRGGTLILEHAQRLPIELDTAARAAAASSAATRVVAVFDRPREPPPNAREARATLLGWARATLLEIPPLCRRLEDIPHLFEHYARPMGAAGRTPMPTAAALVALLTDSWVGNLREFEEVVRASTKRVAHAGAATVGLTDLHHRFARNPGGNALELLSTAFERGLLAEALASHQGRVIESATSLGVPERTLRATMRRLGLSKEDFKPFVGP
jgi:two-component system C4-dicarboxylate transport response regulator DctD